MLFFWLFKVNHNCLRMTQNPVGYFLLSSESSFEAVISSFKQLKAVLINKASNSLHMNLNKHQSA